MTLHLIVTADDLGYSENRNIGILKSLNEGVVQRTSLLVNAAKSEDAALLASQQHICVGKLH